MNTEPAITVTNLGKAYPLFERPWDRLRHLLTGRPAAREFKALSGVSFEVRKGESLGIIGRNGSGKSTLLQIIAGTLAPSEGEVHVSGKIAALLELGSGFNPEFTGRENVYLNGAILGCDRAQMDELFAEIAAFADIGDFIDEPVKEYSSGMMMRLAFAVQVAIRPGILIVDEALSVGDFFFQQKCLRRIRELREQGTTLLFVSHDMAVVRDLCDRAIYLHHGEMAYAGDSSAAIWHYLQQEEQAAIAPAVATPDTGIGATDIPVDAYWVNANASDNSLPATLLGVVLQDTAGRSILQAKMADELVFRVYIRANQDGEFDVGVELKNRYDQIVTSNGSYTLGMLQFALKAGEVGIFEMKMGCMFEAGQYTFQVSADMGAPKPNQGMPVAVSPWLGPITVVWDYETERAPFLGMFGAPVSARFFKSAGN